MNTGYLCLECGSRQVDAKLHKTIDKILEVIWTCRKRHNSGGSTIDLLGDNFDFKLKSNLILKEE